MIRLKLATKDRIYRGIINYLIAYDYGAGLDNRYTVFALNCDDPVTIGRELPLTVVRSVIADFELFAQRLPFYTGGRADVLSCLKQFIVYRKKKYGEHRCSCGGFFELSGAYVHANRCKR